MPALGRADRRDPACQPARGVATLARVSGGEPCRRSPRGPVPDLPRTAGRVAWTPHRTRAVLVAGVAQLQTARRPIRGESMTTAQETSIRTEIVVNAGVERAFQLFTEKFDQIKP